MGFGSLTSPLSGIISGSVSSSGVVSGIGACITVFSLYSVNTFSPTHASARIVSDILSKERPSIDVMLTDNSFS